MSDFMRTKRIKPKMSNEKICENLYHLKKRYRHIMSASHDNIVRLKKLNSMSNLKIDIEDMYVHYHTFYNLYSLCHFLLFYIDNLNKGYLESEKTEVLETLDKKLRFVMSIKEKKLVRVINAFIHNV